MQTRPHIYPNNFPIYPPPFLYEKKTNYVFIVHVLAGISNIILNIVFIPIYGYKAAAFTTVFSYALLFIIGFLTSKYLFTGKHTSIKKLIGPFLVLGVIVFINYSFQFLYINPIFKIAVFLAMVFFIIKWKFNLFKAVSNE